jgi:hypothetical protein
MRGLVLIVLLFCFLAGFGQSDNVERISFTSSTRGYEKQVFISKDSVVILLDGRAGNKTIKRKLSDSEWDDLQKCVRQLNLSEIPTLQSPTSRRAFDGARHSTLTLRINGKEYSHTFDDEDPNAKLADLMKVITKIADSPNEK